MKKLFFIIPIFITACSSYNPYNYERNYLPDIKKEQITTLMVENVLFEVNSFDIQPMYYSYLNLLAQGIIQNNNEIKIIGHTDNSGLEYNNLKLSNERANSVAVYLVSQGVNPKNISIEAYGDKYPLFKNNDDYSKKQNRRVEFLIK